MHATGEDFTSKFAKKNIYHENQIGNMCALHAINAVLQRSGFESEDLIVIADKLDEDERTLLD